MKKTLLVLGVMLAGLCPNTQAQIFIATNTVAPSLGADDVYYLPADVDEATGAMSNTGTDNVASGDNDVLTYIAGNKGSKGQSFTTGTNPNGYLVRAITVRRVRWTSPLSNGTYMSVPNSSGFLFRFGTISGTTLTPIVTTNALYSGGDLNGFTDGDADLYFTFDLSSLGIGTLSPNTTYFFEIASDPSGGSPYFELHNTRTSTLFAGGDAFYGTPNGALDSDGDVTPSDGDFAFHAKLVPGGGPTVTAVAVPSSALPGQSFTVTATATPGTGGAIASVTIDLSSVGGSTSASLVHATGNDYTNTFTISGGATVGPKTLGVTATDASSLLGFYNLSFTVLPAAAIWDGGSLADNKWSSAANWVGDAAPAASGSSLVFAGTTRLTPDMDGNYSATGVTFSNTAGSFVISSSTTGTLTNGSSGVVNNSASAQTLNVPIVLGVAQTFNTAAGDITFSNTVSGGVALTKVGAGTVTFAGAGTNAFGNTLITNGLFKVGAGVVNILETSGALTKIDKGSGVEVSGGTLNISGGGGWFPVGDTADTTNTLTVSGGTVNVTNQYGTQVPRIGNGVLTISSGTFLNNDSGNKGLSIGDNGAAQTGIVNLDGGRLTANLIVSHSGVNKFYFNGGTLAPVASRTDFMNEAGALAVEVRDGGGTIDTAGFDITIGEHLLHSTVGGDNATDGGLTKIGNGTLTMESDTSGYNGPTRVLGGRLLVNISYLGAPYAAGDLVVSNATFVVNDAFGASWPANNILLTNGALLSLTNTSSVPGVSAAGNLTLAGSTISVNVASTPYAAPVTVVGSLSASGANVIKLSGAGLTAGSSFPVIEYSGTPVPTNNITLSLPPGSNGYLTNNAANTSLDVVITASGQNLTWHGTYDTSVLLTNWDINTSENWYDAGLSTAKYLQYNGNAYGDNVTFGDYGYGYLLTGTNSVNLPGRVVPASMAVNSAFPYTLTGSGGIDGATSLVKNNSGYALIGTSNNFTGGTMLNAGTLAITKDSALGANSGGLTIAGGTLQLAGNVISARPVTLTGNATFESLAGVTAQLNGSLTGSTFTLTNIGAGTVGVSGGSLNNLVVNSGTLKITNGTVSVTGTSGGSLVNYNGTLEVGPGGVFNIGVGAVYYPIGNIAGASSTFVVNGGTVTNATANGTVVGRVGSGTLTVNSGLFVDNSPATRGIDIADQSTTTGGTVNLNGGTLVTKNIRCPSGTGNGGAKPAFLYFNGGTLMAGAANSSFLSATTAKLSTQVRANGGMIDNGGFNITIGDPLLHNTDTATDGGLVLQGIGTTLLNGINTYNGPTLVNAGTLAGTGTIAGTLTNNAKLYPGSGGVGTLTVSGAIKLSADSTNTFVVNGTTTTASNRVAAGSSVVYGGVLNIVTNGTFTAGQQFQLFSGTGATNASNFASIAGSPGSGLGFTFTNGVLSVVTVAVGPAGPEHLTNSYSGGVLSLSWPGGEGWRLQMQTNSLSVGLSNNWEYLTDGSVSSTNITVDATKPTVFYRLVYP